MAAERDHTTPVNAAGRSEEPAAVLSNPGRETQPRQPLITAVEIENFKGIGHPIRIDLRPITLLFGRNSAGKSTTLHALCYAHEILSHGNVDAGKTAHGGTQIDLGGFRRFVHGHDLEREVRLRFELNLKDWTVSASLLEKMKRPEYVDPAVADELEEWIESNAPARLARSGWVELTVAWNPWDERPALISYAVGINDALVGHIIHTRDSVAGIHLEFNWAHPVFEPLNRRQRSTASALVAHARETPDSRTHEWGLHRVATYGLVSALPDLNELLALNGDDLNDNEEIAIEEWTETDLAKFQTLLSGLFVGIGQTLRNELARLRHLGPVRQLRPHTSVEPGTAGQGNWSDGSAAWHLLLHQEPDPTRRDLLKDVNDWIARDDRLDTGYRLTRKSTVELPAETPSVSWIRFRERLSAEYRNRHGAVDLNQWTKRLAATIANLYHGDPDDIEAQIKSTGDLNRQAEANATKQGNSTQKELVETVRERYQFLVNLDKLENGRHPSAVRDLICAVAAAPLRTTLQIVTVGSELPVRTSDIGVGISQILPVVAAALDPHRPGITAIEQPELHLHPAMQVELGDLFAQPVDDGRVFLLENHSEHLMLRLLRRIEETHSGELPEGKPPLKPDQISVVFLEQVDGEVRATRLRIDDTGEFIDRWPQGFFDERDDELF